MVIYTGRFWWNDPCSQAVMAVWGEIVHIQLGKMSSQYVYVYILIYF